MRVLVNRPGEPVRKQLVPAAIAMIVVLALSSAVRAGDEPEQGDDASSLARRLTDAVKSHDVAAARQLLDADALFERACAGVTAPADFRAGFRRGFVASAGNDIMGPIIKAAGSGSYRLLRIHQVNGETRVLFRLLTDGGLNYHDWIVGNDRQGRLKFQDLYIGITGELMTQPMHRTYVQAALAAHPGLMDRLRGKDKEVAGNLAKMQEMTRYSDKGQFEELLDDYKTLPKSMKEDKTCLVLRLMAAEKLMEKVPDEYGAAMADYKRLFPDDPSVDLVCLDALIEAKKFDEARKSLDRLDAFTGGDSYLLVLRGITYKTEGGEDNDRLTRQFYKKAIDQEPTLDAAYWAMVTLCLDAKQYDETAALLTRIRRELHVKIGDLTKLPPYAGFVESDAYKKWIADQTPIPASVP
jgi:hypothetical protein